MEQYHQYFAEFLETTDFADIIDETAKLIAPYVEKDPIKFCTTEEFKTGVAAIREFCLLREESVLGQLTGTIPSTDDGQSADGSALVDASHIMLSDMGTMNMGGGKGRGFPSGRPGDQGWQEQRIPVKEGEAPAIGVIPIPNTEGIESPAGDITPDRAEEPIAMPEQGQNNRFPDEPGENMMPQKFGDRMPMGGGGNRTTPEGANNAQSVQSISTIPLLSVSVLVLLLGLFVAKKYRH